jgi:hypothetical protein
MRLGMESLSTVGRSVHSRQQRPLQPTTAIVVCQSKAPGNVEHQFHVLLHKLPVKASIAPSDRPHFGTVDSPHSIES